MEKVDRMKITLERQMSRVQTQYGDLWRPHFYKRFDDLVPSKIDGVVVPSVCYYAVECDDSMDLDRSHYAEFNKNVRHSSHKTSKKLANLTMRDLQAIIEATTQAAGLTQEQILAHRELILGADSRSETYWWRVNAFLDSLFPIYLGLRMIGLEHKELIGDRLGWRSAIDRMETSPAVRLDLSVA